MKRLLFTMIMLTVFLMLMGCNSINSEKTIDNTKNVDTTAFVSADDAARIVVNGKDITNGQYYRYKYSEMQTEIPLLTVLEELGAKVKWKSQTRVKVTCNGNVEQFDTAVSHFNIYSAPGTKNMTRKIQGNDLIIDSQTAKRVIKRLTGAEMTTDDETQTVYFEKTESDSLS